DGERLGLGELEAVSARVLPDERGRVDLRDEVLGLAAQVVRLGERPEIRGARQADRAADLDLAGVVRGLGQGPRPEHRVEVAQVGGDRKSTRLNSSHQIISYAVFCLKK